MELASDLRSGDLVPDTAAGRQQVQRAFHADKIRILCVGGVPGRDDTWNGDTWPAAEIACIPTTVLHENVPPPAEQTRAEATALVLVGGMDAWFDHWTPAPPTWAPTYKEPKKHEPTPPNLTWRGGWSLPYAVAGDLRRRRLRASAKEADGDDPAD